MGLLNKLFGKKESEKKHCYRRKDKPPFQSAPKAYSCNVFGLAPYVGFTEKVGRGCSIYFHKFSSVFNLVFDERTQITHEYVLIFAQASGQNGF